MDDFASNAPTFSTAGPMMPPTPPSRSTPPGNGMFPGSERRRKMDSVASLNEIAERDMAEFMSSSARSFSSALPGYTTTSQLKNQMMPDSDGYSLPIGNFQSTFSEETPIRYNRERAAPQASPMFGNFPMLLPQGQHLGGIVTSQPGYGPPLGPLIGSPPAVIGSQYLPMSQMVSVPAQMTVQAIPSTPQLAAIPSNRYSQPTLPVPQVMRASHSVSPSTSQSQPSPPIRSREMNERQRERAQAPPEMDDIVPAQPQFPPAHLSNGQVSSAPAIKSSRTIPAALEKKEDENDITISFRPKISLVKGEIVRLVLAEFQGSDAAFFHVSSLPAGAFVSASWTGKTQILALTVGSEIPAHERITAIIPANIGIRKLQESAEPKERESNTRERSAPPREPAVTSMPSTSNTLSRNFAKDAINIELKLQMNMEDVASNIETFKADVVLDVARAAGIFPGSLHVSSLQAGSIILHLAMAADVRDAQGRNAMEIAHHLEEQANDPSSVLFRGKHTSKTMSLQVAQPRTIAQNSSMRNPEPIRSPRTPAERERSRPIPEERSPEEEKRFRAEEKRKKFLQNGGSKAEKERSQPVDSNEPVGIDISFAINLRPPGVVVADLKPDGAALISGQLCKGDLITKINGKPLTSSVSKAEVSSMLLGLPGSTVTLEVIRANPKTGNLETREAIISRLFGGRTAIGQYKSTAHSREDYIDAEDVSFDEIPMFDEVPHFDTVDFPDDGFTAIPARPEDLVSLNKFNAQGNEAETLTQAEWARRMLQQKPVEERKAVQTMNLDAVRQQAQWAKEQLNNAPEQEHESKFDASSVAQQAQWAKEQLSRHDEQERASKFDAGSVAQQAQWAKEQLGSLPEHRSPPKFDAASVAQQAQWAKGQLGQQAEPERAPKFDASSVAQQSQWAKGQLHSFPEKGQGPKFDAESVAQQAQWAKGQLQQRSA